MYAVRLIGTLRQHWHSQISLFHLFSC